MISTNSLKVGDTIKLPVYPLSEPIKGTIVYIHPQRRFFQVEFDTPYGTKVRESYPFNGPLLPVGTRTLTEVLNHGKTR